MRSTHGSPQRSQAADRFAGHSWLAAPHINDQRRQARLSSIMPEVSQPEVGTACTRIPAPPCLAVSVLLLLLPLLLLLLLLLPLLPLLPLPPPLLLLLLSYLLALLLSCSSSCSCCSSSLPACYPLGG